MALSDKDRALLNSCLTRQPKAWDVFVDRFLGLVVHVVQHTAESRSVQLDASAREDLVAEVFLNLVANDFAPLRRFRGNSSLATYLTVISRRVVVRELFRRSGSSATATEIAPSQELPSGDSPIEQRIENDEEVQALIRRLDKTEAEVVRRYHLDGMSYAQIAEEMSIPENTIGPLLSRARAKMRAAEVK